MWTFTVEELGLLQDALERAAARHKSEAKYYPPRAARHRAKARAMLALAKTIKAEIEEIRAKAVA